MKRSIATIITAFVFVISLSACAATIVDSELSKEETALENSEIISVYTENNETVGEYIEEITAVIDDNIIDFSFTQVIDNTLPPFTFRIFGDRMADRVDSIHVINADGVLIQEINDIKAWPGNASEYNLFGFEFDDYNFDGYLDMSIRRFPGESSHDRTHYYWLWDNDLQQFVYDWKLSEAVTEENFIEFSVIQSIHDEMPPFTFRLLGRFIEGWSSDVSSRVTGIQPNIHIVQVVDMNGNIIQELDNLNAFPPLYADSFGLHFADYNFDGFLDIALFVHEGGSLRNSPHYYWLWDDAIGQFVYNHDLSRISEDTTIVIYKEHQGLEAYWRGSLALQGSISIEYIDGAFVEVGALITEFTITPGGNTGMRTTTIDLINDTKIITYEIID